MAADMHEIHTSLINSPAALSAILFVLGASIGSFINVVALRLPPLLFHQWKNQCTTLLKEQNINCDNLPDHKAPNLFSPGSRCPQCLRPLRFFHNIPIISFFLLVGKCSYCRSTISIRYPIVELMAALTFVFLGFVYGPDWNLIFSLIFTCAMITLSLIDIDHQLLPDNIVLPLLWSGLLANCLTLFTELQSAVLGAIVGYLGLWLIYQAHHRLTGREGIGYGDFKLLAAIGAWLGWQMLLIVVMLASIAGALIAVCLMIARKQGRDVPIPFGPYLALSAWVTMLWGDDIFKNYLQMFNL